MVGGGQGLLIFVHHMNYSITSTGEIDNVVHHMNTFIASSLAFGCHVSCHRRIFVVGLLFLSTAVTCSESSNITLVSKKYDGTVYSKIEPVL